MDREISGILHEKVLEDGRTLCLLLDYDGNVVLTSWKEKPEKKKSVKKQLSDKKEKAAKTAKPKKVDTKNLGEAI